jgi:hypothetical protein
VQVFRPWSRAPCVCPVSTATPPAYCSPAGPVIPATCATSAPPPRGLSTARRGRYVLLEASVCQVRRLFLKFINNFGLQIQQQQNIKKSELNRIQILISALIFVPMLFQSEIKLVNKSNKKIITITLYHLLLATVPIIWPSARDVAPTFLNNPLLFTAICIKYILVCTRF